MAIWLHRAPALSAGAAGGKCWGKVSGQSTLLDKRPVQPRSAAPNVRHRTSTILNRISGYRTGKSCEQSHVVKAGPVQSGLQLFASTLETCNVLQ